MQNLVFINTDSMQDRRVVAHMMSDYADKFDGDCFIVRPNAVEYIEEVIDAVEKLLQGVSDSAVRIVAVPETEA